jgi:hypothetical protein
LGSVGLYFLPRLGTPQIGCLAELAMGKLCTEASNFKNTVVKEKV